MDWIPVVSQIKSFVQFVGGDSAAAKETQENFSKQCPVISQARSAVEAAMGDRIAAKATQKEFLRNGCEIVESIPAVGHAVAAVYYAKGDKVQGERAILSAFRSTAVIGAGTAAIFVAGPPGAFAAGTAAGVAYDGAATGILSKTKKKFCPYGNVANAVNVKRDPKNPTHYVHLVFLPVADGVTSMCTAKAIRNVAVAALSSETSVTAKGMSGSASTVFTRTELVKDYIMEILEDAPLKILQLITRLATDPTQRGAILQAHERLEALTTQGSDNEEGFEELSAELVVPDNDDDAQSVVSDIMEEIPVHSDCNCMNEQEQVLYDKVVKLLVNFNEEELETFAEELCEKMAMREP